MVLILVLHYALNYKLTTVFYAENQCVLELNDWRYVAKENMSQFQCRHRDILSENRWVAYGNL